MGRVSCDRHRSGLLRWSRSTGANGKRKTILEQRRRQLRTIVLPHFGISAYITCIITLHRRDESALMSCRVCHPRSWQKLDEGRGMLWTDGRWAAGLMGH